MSKKQHERQSKGVLVASEGPQAADASKKESKPSQKAVAGPKATLVAVLGLGALLVFAWLGSFVVPLPEIDGDGFHFKHWVQTNFELASSAVDTSVMSPFQGLAGLVQPLAVWVHPAYVIPHLLSPGADRACSLFIAMTLMALATYMLGRSNGLPTAVAVLGAQLMVMFTFPPMAQWSHSLTHINAGATFYRTLQGFSVPVALGTMLLAVYSYLGRLSRNGNIVCVLLLPALVAYTITIDPLYTAMFFIPIAALLTGVFLGSDNRTVLLWRLGGGAFCLLVSLVLHLPSFYRGLAGYAARATFPNELYVEIQKWDHLTTLFFQGGLASVGIVLMVLSCVATLYFGPPQARGFALAVLGYQWLMILVCMIYVYSGIRWSQPLPEYLEVGAEPAYVVATLLGLCLVAQQWFQRRRTQTKQAESPGPLAKPWLAYGSVLVLPAIGIVWGLAVHKEPPPSEDIHPAAGLTKFLEDRLMIGTNGLFRGSVCTIIAVPGGGILNRVGVPESMPFNKNFIGWMEGYGPTFAPDFNMTGLWVHRIPTLEDNNHLVTPAFHFITSRPLSRPQDYHSRNWAVVTRANPKIMAVLGAKFLVTDYELTDPLLIPSGRTSNPDGMTLFIYEIKDANTGGLSPTRTILSTNAAETLSLMTSTNVNLNEVAIVYDQPLTGLTPADSGAIFYEKGGIRVRAKSHGPSLIVLPVQFSNSLKITSTTTNSSTAPIKLVRVNLLQTGVLFNGEVDFKFAHIFGPFRGVKGRLQDIKDSRKLGIKETGEIPYPNDYQPLGPKAVPR